MLRKCSLIFAILLSCVIVAFVSQKAYCAPTGDLSCDVGKELNLPVTEWLDKEQPVKGIVVAVHGLTLYAGAFEPIAVRLASRGFRVYALDMRGFGRWRSEGQNFAGDNRIHVGQSQTDLVALVKRLRKDNPDQKLFFLGESQGTNLAMWLVENHPELTDGAILASPCYHTRVHPTARWIVDGAKELVKLDRPLDLEPYTRPYLTNDPVLTEKCDKDPLVNRKMTPDELVKCLIENRRAIKQATQIPADYPVLMVAGAKDAVFKARGLPKEVKKFGNAKEISLTLLPGKGHLLIEHQPVDPQIGKLVDTWLDQQIASPRMARRPLEDRKIVVAGKRPSSRQSISEVPDSSQQ